MLFDSSSAYTDGVYFLAGNNRPFSSNHRLASNLPEGSNLEEEDTIR